jgi:DNA polymerase III epsilon subunit-like protein
MKNKVGVYLAIDTEASGVLPHRHGLIEVATVVLDKNLEIVDQLVVDIKPPKSAKFDPEAMKVNGISMERIEKGISYKMFCKKFLKLVEKNFEAKPVVIAQFYPFDNAFLTYVFDKAGYKEGFNGAIMGNDYIDTKSLTNSFNLISRLKGEPLKYPVTSLSKKGGLKEKFGLNGEEFKSHTALGDVKMTIAVLKKLLDL